MISLLYLSKAFYFSLWSPSACQLVSSRGQKIKQTKHNPVEAVCVCCSERTDKSTHTDWVLQQPQFHNALSLPRGQNVWLCLCSYRGAYSIGVCVCVCLYKVCVCQYHMWCISTKPLIIGDCFYEKLKISKLGSTLVSRPTTTCKMSTCWEWSSSCSGTTDICFWGLTCQFQMQFYPCDLSSTWKYSKKKKVYYIMNGKNSYLWSDHLIERSLETKRF